MARYSAGKKKGSPRLGDLSRLQLPGVAKAGSTEVRNIYSQAWTLSNAIPA